MPVQHSPPTKNTRSQRNPAVLTPTARVPVECTPSVDKMSANLDRGPQKEGAAPYRRGGMKSRRSIPFSGLLGGYPGMSEGARARLGEIKDEEVEESLEEEDSWETEVAHFDGTQVHKLRGFIQSCKFIFHNDPANFFSDRKKVLYSTSFLTDPSYLLNNWQLFEAQLFTLFGDPNEFREAEKELENLRMKESGHVSLYISDFRSLISRIRDWGERAYIHVYRRGLESTLLNQLASYPGNSDTLHKLMDITLDIDTRYHERQKEKGSHQEKKPPVAGANSSRPAQE
ncbi:hypothetical protein O181_074988 [Austropuccinia psidii MF-1]|uniref:Retrotransposon gag domain-containing protein n=1 Tax=Austropuccinia psidii MF-1 TaxID=1389203 RepID=A0A9Q3FC47_9BASI|nr:hypothetical protein [Austropuccinia psidii MF-1]